MKRIALALAGLVMMGAAPALAQYQYAPRPVMPVGPMPPDSVFEMVRSMGLEPMGPPMRNGPVYIQRASDYYGRPLRVVVDASRAQVLSVEPMGGPPAVYGGPYASTGGPYWRRAYPAYGAMPDDDVDYAPPGSVLAPRGQPPRATVQPHPSAIPPLPSAPPVAQRPRPATKSAAVTPARPPVPRKRPAVAPQEAAGSVDPLPAKSETAAPAAVPQNVPPSAAPAPAPERPAAPAMAPVAPLN